MLLDAALLRWDPFEDNQRSLRVESKPPAPGTAPTPSTSSRTKGRFTCHMTVLGDAAGCHVCSWPLSSVVLTQQFGSDRSNSGHGVDMVATQMTRLHHWQAADALVVEPLLVC